MGEEALERDAASAQGLAADREGPVPSRLPSRTKITDFWISHEMGTSQKQPAFLRSAKLTAHRADEPISAIELTCILAPSPPVRRAADIKLPSPHHGLAAASRLLDPASAVPAGRVGGSLETEIRGVASHQDSSTVTGTL